MTYRARRPAGPGLIILALLIAGAAMLALSGWQRGRDARPVSRYEPSPVVPRIGFAGDTIPDVMLIRDFDMLDDRLYLLDGGARRVVVMRDSAGGWGAVHSFGAPGGGPGEMQQPSGIAVHPVHGEVIIADQGRLHYYTDSGKYIRSRQPVMPCYPMQPRIAAAGSGLLISGRCTRDDVVSVELFFLADSDTAVAVASQPLAAAGSPPPLFATDRPYAAGHAHGLFGGGLSDCVFRIEMHRGPPVATPLCSIASGSYAFEADAEFRAAAEAMASARPWMAAAFAIPDQLPLYMDLLPGDSIDFVLRPVTADSLVFRVLGENTDRAVAGVHELVGCRAGGCLWMRYEPAPEMMFVSARRVLSMSPPVSAVTAQTVRP